MHRAMAGEVRCREENEVMGPGVPGKPPWVSGAQARDGGTTRCHLLSGVGSKVVACRWEGGRVTIETQGLITWWREV